MICLQLTERLRYVHVAFYPVGFSSSALFCSSKKCVFSRFTSFKREIDMYLSLFSFPRFRPRRWRRKCMQFVLQMNANQQAFHNSCQRHLREISTIHAVLPKWLRPKVYQLSACSAFKDVPSFRQSCSICNCLQSRSLRFLSCFTPSRFAIVDRNSCMKRALSAREQLTTKPPTREGQSIWD